MITMVKKVESIYAMLKCKEPLNVDMIIAAVDDEDEKHDLELQLSTYEPHVKRLVLAFKDAEEPTNGALTLEQAKEIIGFLCENQGTNPKKTRVIFACPGGVCRSATMAMFADFCWNQLSIARFMFLKFFPNKHMLYKLTEAYKEIFGEYVMDYDTIDALCHLSEIRYLRENLRAANQEIAALTIDLPGPGRAFGEV